ncbi:MAG: transposase [Ktedonobacteraceae bacterium]
MSQIGQTPLAREDATFVEQELGRIGEANAWTIGALNVQEDQVHLFLSASPAIAPAQIASTLRGTTRRLVFQRFPEVKKQLWAVRSGLVRTSARSVGDLSVDTILNYIELEQDYRS